MAKTKKTAKKPVKRQDKWVCSPCGREITVGNWGVSEETVWCCGKPMQKKS